MKLPFLINKEVSEIKTTDDLKIIFKNIFNGIFNIFEKEKFEKITLDIPFINYQKLSSNREKALGQEKDRQFMSEKTKVSAKLSYKEKIYPVEIRIKGDRADHYASSSRISLDIEFVGNNSIFGFKRFSLQNHLSRQFPENEVLSNFLGNNGIITPKFKTINLQVNGNNWGQMYLEESISPSFFENRKLKETPISRFTNQERQIIISNFKKNYSVQELENFFDQYGKFETRVYKESKYKKNFLTKSMISTARLIHDNFNNIDLSIDTKESLLIDRIDIEKFANLLALNSVIKSWHATTYTNLKFYFNPYNGMVEPIPSDFIIVNQIYTDMNYFTKVFLSETNNFYFKILNNEKFIESYFNFIAKILLNINNFNQDIKQLCDNFNVIDCGKNFNSNILKANSQFILHNRKKIESLFKKKESDLINAKNNFLMIDVDSKLKNDQKFLDISRKIINNYIYSRAFSDGSFFIKNISPFEIYIKDIKINFKNKPQEEKFSKNNELDIHGICMKNIFINKKIAPKFLWRSHVDFNLDSKLKKCFEFASSIEIYLYENSRLFVVEIDLESSIFKEFTDFDRMKNIEKFIVGKNIILKTGKHFFNDPLILPNGYSLVVEKGSKLFFSENSYIYIDGGNLQINGTKLEPVSLIPKNNNNFWRGLYVKNSQKSKISHAHFQKLNYFYSKELFIFLTGAINFYKSEVQIEHTQFTDSFCEDFINIINSKFDIKNIAMKNSYSDGIDLDYSDGLFENIFFYNIGGDAVDTSGSETVVKNMNAMQISDKGISIGEGSVSYVENSKFSKSKFGIAIKDGSKLKSKNIEFFNNKYDVGSYMKKSFYSELNESFVNTTSRNLKIFKDESSKIYINQKLINISNFKQSELND